VSVRVSVTVRVSLIRFLSSKTLATLRVAIWRTAVCERLNVGSLGSRETLPVMDDFYWRMFVYSCGIDRVP